MEYINLVALANQLHSLCHSKISPDIEFVKRSDLSFTFRYMFDDSRGWEYNYVTVEFTTDCCYNHSFAVLIYTYPFKFKNVGDSRRNFVELLRITNSINHNLSDPESSRPAGDARVIYTCMGENEDLPYLYAQSRTVFENRYSNQTVISSLKTFVYDIEVQFRHFRRFVF